MVSIRILTLHTNFPATVIFAVANLILKYVIYDKEQNLTRTFFLT